MRQRIKISIFFLTCLFCSIVNVHADAPRQYLESLVRLAAQSRQSPYSIQFFQNADVKKVRVSIELETHKQVAKYIVYLPASFDYDSPVEVFELRKYLEILGAQVRNDFSFNREEWASILRRCSDGSAIHCQYVSLAELEAKAKTFDCFQRQTTKEFFVTLAADVLPDYDPNDQRVQNLLKQKNAINRERELLMGEINRDFLVRSATYRKRLNTLMKRTSSQGLPFVKATAKNDLSELLPWEHFSVKETPFWQNQVKLLKNAGRFDSKKKYFIVFRGRTGNRNQALVLAPYFKKLRSETKLAFLDRISSGVLNETGFSSWKLVNTLYSRSGLLEQIRKHSLENQEGETNSLFMSTTTSLEKARHYASERGMVGVYLVEEARLIPNLWNFDNRTSIGFSNYDEKEVLVPVALTAKDRLGSFTAEELDAIGDYENESVAKYVRVKIVDWLHKKELTKLVHPIALDQSDLSTIDFNTIKQILLTQNILQYEDSYSSGFTDSDLCNILLK